MDNYFSEHLLKKGLITFKEHEKIQSGIKNQLFSLHYELKTLLYLGVLMFAGGLGMLVYLNIDTIGHQVILLAIALACAGCFYYCHRHAEPFSLSKTESKGIGFDYLLLLGCLLFLTFEGYLQYQHEIFGTLYGLATFIPSVFLLFVSYRYDHKGILSLGITGLAAWVGLSVTPLDILKGENTFASTHLVWTAVAFSLVVSGLALMLGEKKIKKHFTPTYLNFTINLLFVALLAGLFMNEGPVKYLFFFLIAGFAAASFFYARKTQSFYYLLVSVVAMYIAATWLYLKFTTTVGSGEGMVYMWYLYFMVSCLFVVVFISNHKKLLKS